MKNFKDTITKLNSDKKLEKYIEKNEHKISLIFVNLSDVELSITPRFEKFSTKGKTSTVKPNQD